MLFEIELRKRQQKPSAKTGCCLGFRIALLRVALWEHHFFQLGVESGEKRLK
jgi:hypothetical protein